MTEPRNQPTTWADIENELPFDPRETEEYKRRMAEQITQRCADGEHDRCAGYVGGYAWPCMCPHHKDHESESCPE